MFSALGAVTPPHDGYALRAYSVENVVFRNCDFLVAYSMWFGDICTDVIFDGCDFYGIYDCNNILGGNIVGASFSDCTVQNYDESNTADGEGWAKGRFLGGSNQGANHWYIGDNTSTDMRPRLPSAYYADSPLGISAQAEMVLYYGRKYYPQTVTVADIPEKFDGRGGRAILHSTDPDLTPATKDVFNRGYVLYDKIDASKNTFTILVEDWVVLPLSMDYDFSFSIRDEVDQNAGEQILWEGGATGYRGNPLSTTTNTATFSDLSSYGISANGVYYVQVGQGRGLGQMREVVGVSGETLIVSPAWTVTPDPSSTLLIGKYGVRWAIYNNYFDGIVSETYSASAGVQLTGGTHSFIVDGNTFHETRTGISSYPEMFTEYDYDLSIVSPQYFNLYKDNLLIGNQYAFKTSVWEEKASNDDPYSDPSVLGNVRRMNIVTNCSEIALTISMNDLKHSGISVYDSNMFSDFVGLQDISGLHTNQIYQGNITNGVNWYLPGSSLEIPLRFLKVKGSAGSLSVAIWNRGNDPLEWTARSEADSWLELLKVSGSVSNEANGDKLFLKLISEPDVGSQTVVTVTGGGQTKKITVVYEGEGQVSLHDESEYTLAGLGEKTLKAEVVRVSNKQIVRTIYPEESVAPSILTVSHEGLFVGEYLIWLYEKSESGWDRVTFPGYSAGQDPILSIKE
jgi:hypothetical protein